MLRALVSTTGKGTRILYHTYLDRQWGDCESHFRAGRVGEKATKPRPTLPSSNRRCSFPASGSPENCRLRHAQHPTRTDAPDKPAPAELLLSAEVQMRLFPENYPDTATVQLFGVCLPARGVGGDYYDFPHLDNGRIGIAFADVASKGIAAALIMLVVQASLRSLAGSHGASLAELTAKMIACCISPPDPAAMRPFSMPRSMKANGSFVT